MTSYSLLGISGALRKGSTNTALVHEAARIFEATHFELADLNLPLFNEDDQHATGIPEAVQKLADQIKAADAVVISTPEYNKNLSGVLKNALDWVSRTKGMPWRGKPVAVMSASDGRAGGERAQYSLRHCLTPFRPRLLPGPEMMLANARESFDEHGQLNNERSAKSLALLMEALKAEVDLLRLAESMKS